MEDSNSTADSSTELCASLDSLKVNGVPPAQGDSVSVTLDGTISRIDGDNAYITPAKINGQDVMKDDAEPDEGSEDSMMAMAQKADAGGY